MEVLSSQYCHVVKGTRGSFIDFSTLLASKTYTTLHMICTFYLFFSNYTIWFMLISQQEDKRNKGNHFRSKDQIYDKETENEVK